MDEPAATNLAHLLRDARQRMGLTQHEVATRAGVSLGALRDLEQGRSSRPRARSVRALAEVLGLTAEQATPARPPAPRTPEAPARIAVLGPLVVTRAADPVPLGAGRHRVVLARLALTPGRAVRPDELIDLLWGEGAPPSAHNVLQTHVSRLRRLLKPATIPLSPAGYRLRAEEDQLDLLAFRSRLDRARAPGLDPQRQFDLLADALDLWHGDTPAEDVPELHGDPAAVALIDEGVDAAIRLARLGETLRRHIEVLPRLRRLTGRHQWHEALHARLVVALAATGQQAAALDAYDEIRDRLVDELGLDPGDELAEARQAVLRPARQRDDSGRSDTGIPWQAPSPPADFLGRTVERRRLERLLRFPEPGRSTVCVISGMAGVGKTSLALRVARSVRPDFPDGQLYLDLRGADPRPVTTLEALAQLLRGLGVESRAVPGDAAEAEALYRTVLADRRTLIVLDNARGAAQVRPLLPGAGDNAVLVTSRNQCVELDGAALLPLPVPTRDEALGMLGRGDATGTERETAVSLAEACGRLPIALRVAAGRLVSRPQWSMRDLLDRLVDERHALAELSLGDLAVTAAFELSYGELGPFTAAAFRAAALVPGADFATAAVAALLGADPRRVQVAVDTLVAENLVQVAPRPGRYRYHDLLRLFATQAAAGALGENDRAAAFDRLLDWYLARTAAAMRLVYAEMVRLPVAAGLPADPGFADIAAAEAWLDDEIDGLAAVIDDAAAQGSERSWQLADQLRGYFFLRRDAVTWLRTGRAGLAAAEAAGDDRARAAMHQTVGQALWSLGKPQLALAAYEQGEAAARAGDWPLGEAYLLHNSGLVQAELGRIDEARESYRRALALAETPEFDHVRAVTLNDLGTLCYEQGRLSEAVDHFSAALAISQQNARHRSAMAQRHNLGMVLRQLEQFDAARDHLGAAMAYFREANVVDGEMCALDELSQLYAQLGEWSAAVDTGDRALRLAIRTRDVRATAALTNTLGFALLGARAITDAHARFAEAHELSRRHGFRYFEAQAAVGLAGALLAQGDVNGAAEAAGQALAVADSKGYRALAGDALLALARTALAQGEHAAAVDHCRAAREHYATTSPPSKIRETDLLAAEAALA